MTAAASGADLARGDLGAHLRRLAVPAAAGFVFASIFNLTDTYYAGLLGSTAQESLGYSFPLFFILISCCVGLGQAVTAAIGRALGARRATRAAHCFFQSLILAALLAAAIFLLAVFAAEPMLAALGAQGEARAGALVYIRLVYAAAPVFLLVFVQNGFLQALGETRSYRNGLILAAVLNIGLDPLFMFTLNMGVGGAGAATAAAQAAVAAYLFFALRRRARAALKNGGAPLQRRLFIPRPTTLKMLAGQAWPPAGNMLSIGAGFFIITYWLAALDDRAVAAYNIALRIEQAALLPAIISLAIAQLAVSSQNWGARQTARVDACHKLAARYGLILSVIGAALMVTAGAQLAAAFTDSAQVAAGARDYLLAAAALSPAYVYIHTAGAVLQAAGRPRALVLAGAMRLLVAPPLFFWFFAEYLQLGVRGVWLGLVAGNFLAAGYLHWKARRVMNAALVIHNKRAQPAPL